MRPEALLVAAAAAALAGCETLSYYAQAVGGHMSLMSRAHPVEALIADPATAQALREKLELAQALRDFATRELKLPDNASYRSYADLGRPFALWNVVAAPEFSLEPVKSCFPVAGCVSYLGFFAREDAERHARSQRERGSDVYLYGVPAYSTLGRFDDPLLSTFIGYPDAELARLVFHELAHQVVYVKDDSTFNESFAVAVEREGVRRWLAASGRHAELRAFLDAQRRSAELGALLEDTRVRLEVLYRLRLAPEAMRERKRAELALLKEKLARYPKLGAVEPNNAFLASHATYTQLVPAFERLLAAGGGDFERFYAKVRELAKGGAGAARAALTAPSGPAR